MSLFARSTEETLKDTSVVANIFIEILRPNYLYSCFKLVTTRPRDAECQMRNAKRELQNATLNNRGNGTRTANRNQTGPCSIFFPSATTEIRIGSLKWTVDEIEYFERC